jgi:hypothetical protein
MIPAEGAAIDPDLLKYGFIGFAVALALIALYMFQDANKHGVNAARFRMFITFLLFSLALALMGLVSPMIPTAASKDREQLAKVQIELQNMRAQVKTLLDVKAGAVSRLQESRASGSNPHQAEIDEIAATLQDLDNGMQKAIGETNSTAAK